MLFSMDELVIQALVWKDAQDIITKAGYSMHRHDSLTVFKMSNINNTHIHICTKTKGEQRKFEKGCSGL